MIKINFEEYKMKELYESTYDFSTSSGRKAREVIISIVTKVWV